MNDRLKLFSQATAAPPPTSSPASADGPMRSGSQDGPQTTPSGQVPAPASHSAPPGHYSGKPTGGTYGPLFCTSSASAALQQSLENKLRAALDLNGSPEYALIWKHWDMPSGPPICALRAKGRYIAARGCIGGLPTPMSVDYKGGGVLPSESRGRGNNLRDFFRQKHGFLYPPANIVRWLMGYPIEWDDCAVTAMPSSRKLRQRS